MEKKAYLTPESISDVDWENTPESVKRFLAVLLERIKKQEKHLDVQQAEIDGLKEKLHLNSSNSSEPPSADVEKLRSETKTNQRFFEVLNNDVKLEMVLIKGGAFMMGSPELEIDRKENESPQHSVAILQFFMGRYPITQSQWRVVAQIERVNQDLDPDPSHFKGDDHPVEKVSWVDAVEFCDRISQQTGRIYRLPTEAEWEYACRAGTTTPFHFGKTISDELANYRASSVYGKGLKGKYREETTSVHKFNAPNNFGLHDMHGNVYEWCMDYLHGRYVGAPTNGQAWLDGGDDTCRVIRGGSWNKSPALCRSASRHYISPAFRGINFGFRIVCEFQGTP